LHEKGRFVKFALFGIVLSSIGLSFTVLIFWLQIIFEDIITEHWKQLATFFILASSTTHSSLLLLIESDRLSVNVVRFATIFSTYVLALMLIVLVFEEFYLKEFFFGLDEFFFRVLGVFAILDALGTFVTVILNKLYPSKEETTKAS
jgi:hypothetical protein